MYHTLLTLCLIAAQLEVRPESHGLTEALPTPVLSEANETLQALLREAAQNNAGLKARYEEWRAAVAKIPFEGALDEPMVTYRQFVRAQMAQYEVMLEQNFPWFGVRALRRHAAAKEAEILRLRFVAERNTLFRQVKEAYYDLHYAHARKQILNDQEALLRYAEEVIRTKYAVGLANFDELLRMQNEITLTQNMVRETELLIPALEARLRSLLNRTSGEPIAITPTPLPALVLPPLEALLETMATHNPTLGRRDEEIQRAEVLVDLAGKMKYPELRLGLSYMVGRDPGRLRMDPWEPGKLMAYRNLFQTATGRMPLDPVGTAIDAYEAFRYTDPMGRGEDVFSVEVSASVPIWRRKIKSAISEAQHTVTASQHEAVQSYQELTAMLSMAYYEANDALRRMDLYVSELIPRSRQSYEAIQSAYASGEVSVTFLDMLNALQQRLTFELEELRAEKDAYQAAARIEEMIGAGLRSTQSAERPEDIPVVEAESIPEP
jgi:outer membrane protein TolC